MDDINKMWRRAVKCFLCHDTGWILSEKPVPEIYGDNIPIRFAKRCSCGYRENRE